jgi:hypothetical protein
LKEAKAELKKVGGKVLGSKNITVSIVIGVVMVAEALLFLRFGGQVSLFQSFPENPPGNLTRYGRLA